MNCIATQQHQQMDIARQRAIFCKLRCPLSAQRRQSLFHSLAWKMMLLLRCQRLSESAPTIDKRRSKGRSFQTSATIV